MINIREIVSSDNDRILDIIREVMTEYKGDPETTILGDPSINHMYENYRESRAVYFVAEIDGKVIGGCGIRRLEGCVDQTCELQRMFLLADARGKGIGKQLLALSLQKAAEFGYKQVYLETLPHMKSAIGLYEKAGFTYLDNALGSTGHTGCNVWMIRAVK